MLNRDLESERELVLEWRDLTPTRVLACETLTGPDLKAFNTFEEPKRVVPRPLEPPAAAARMTFKLPARSYYGGAARRPTERRPHKGFQLDSAAKYLPHSA